MEQVKALVASVLEKLENKDLLVAFAVGFALGWLVL
jgi:uncharacterized protein YebE (UPF0316 family)